MKEKTITFETIETKLSNTETLVVVYKKINGVIVRKGHYNLNTKKD